MEFITIEDCNTDNILTCEEVDVKNANDYLTKLATTGFGLALAEIAMPTSPTVKQLGIYKAYQLRAMAMVGSDTTVMVDGSRGSDIYKQKYEMYSTMFKNLKAELDYSDFAKDEVGGAGKGGVGVIRMTRA